MSQFTVVCFSENRPDRPKQSGCGNQLRGWGDLMHRRRFLLGEQPPPSVALGLQCRPCGQVLVGTTTTPFHLVGGLA
jgi:hypothetical protein